MASIQSGISSKNGLQTVNMAIPFAIERYIAPIASEYGDEI